MRWTGYVARMRGNINACRVLVGNTEGKVTEDVVVDWTMM